jgi:hypothetical protein
LRSSSDQRCRAGTIQQQVRYGTASVDTIKTFYREAGERDVRTLLLLHSRSTCIGSPKRPRLKSMIHVVQRSQLLKIRDMHRCSSSQLLHDSR